MSQIIKFEVVSFNAARMIGKQVVVSMNPGSENPVPALWQAIIHDGTLERLTSMPERSTPDPDTIGWMGDYNPETNEFTYIAGVLTQPDTRVPDGCAYRDIPACEMGIGSIQGSDKDGDLYNGAHDHTARMASECGYEYDDSAGGFEMEYYSYSRFIEPAGRNEAVLVLEYYSPCRKRSTIDHPLSEV